MLQMPTEKTKTKTLTGFQFPGTPFSSQKVPSFHKYIQKCFCTERKKTNLNHDLKLTLFLTGHPGKKISQTPV